MRFIRIRPTDFPPADWLAKAKAVTELLEAARTDKERRDIIDANSQVYRDLRDWLLKKSHGKCWFSEAEDIFSYYDVEHYRPKKEAKDQAGNIREGYWWLAFDWSNLRICGNVGNRKKGGYFPVRDTALTATSADRRIEEELPLLLDPTCHADTTVIDFNEAGGIVPSPGTSEWNLARLEESVTRYKLDFEALEQKRKSVWAACQREINHCQNEMEKCSKHGGAVANDRIKQAFERLAEMVTPQAELSSVAVSCLLASDLRWAARIAASATG